MNREEGKLKTDLLRGIGRSEKVFNGVQSLHTSLGHRQPEEKFRVRALVVEVVEPERED